MTFPLDQSGIPSAQGGQVPGGPLHPQGYVLHPQGYVPNPHQSDFAPPPPQAFYAQPGQPPPPQNYYAPPDSQAYNVPQAAYGQPQAQNYYASEAAPPVHYAGQGHGPAVFPSPSPAYARNRWPWVAGGIAVFLAVTGVGIFGIAAQSRAQSDGQVVSAVAARGNAATDRAALAQLSDKMAQSDVRAAISAVEQYYTDNGNSYPEAAVSGDNSDGSMPQVALGYSPGWITLSKGTRLFYAPSPPPTVYYRICATNTTGSGKWYSYDSSRGGSVSAVRPPADPATCT